MPNRLLSAARALLLVSLVTGCTLAPSGLETEEALLTEAGERYAKPWEDRALPELPDEPEWSDVLRRACLANGELEAAYYGWARAIHRVQQAGGYPNTPLSLGFEQMFRSGTSFDGTTIRIGPDAMENLSFPPKVYQAAKVALEEARAAKERFTEARLNLQRRVLNAWLDYALSAERIRIQEANLALLKLITETAISRVQAGAQQQDLLRAEVEQRRADDNLRTLEAELPTIRTTLNALMAREPEAALRPPERIPDPRPLALDDSTLLFLTGTNNPELAALGDIVNAREDALELARLRYIPDFNPFMGVTGSVSQVVGMGVSIPTFLPEVRGLVKEAKAELAKIRATYRQTTVDRKAQVVAALYALRNSERQGRLFEERILPAAERIVESARDSYATGTGSFIDLIDTQRVLLDVRLVAAEARAAREKTLADLEALVGVDLAGGTFAISKPLVTLGAVIPRLPFPEKGDE